MDVAMIDQGDRLAPVPSWLRGVMLFSLLSMASVSLADSVCVEDDLQRLVCLDAPAERIISLSPGVTELLFAAGAGESIVGTTSFSDYPEAAEAIPRVGSYKRIDMENLLAREADLVVAWISGNPTEQVERLDELGLTVYWGEQRDFEDIAHTLERYGRLAGTESAANQAARDFREGIQALAERHADAPLVSYFYQIWDDPMMTVNGEHLISEAAAVCGGENIFGDLPRLTPRVDRESVLAADPEVIVAGGMGESNPAWLDPWREYRDMTAVKRDNLFFIPPSTIQRPTPRLLTGMRTLCDQLEQARERR